VTAIPTMTARPRSLQGRLLVLVLGGVSVLWLATALITWNDARKELDELLDGHLAQAAALLVVQQTRDLDHSDDDGEVDAPPLHRYAPRVAFQVWHEGRLAMRSSNAPAQPMTARGGRHAKGFESLTIDGVAWRVFGARGAERDVQVFVGEHESARRDIVWALLRGTLWPLAAVLPLLGLAVWWAVRKGTAPLRALGATLAARQPQALDAVALKDAPAEMLPMLEALNRLFGRIGAMVDSERRFTADAAHELRTPIAAIRAQAQVALMDPDEAGRRHALQATLEGCDRATRLVEQLLTLSRLEAGATPGQGTTSQGTMDLGAVVRRVVAELAPRALARQQQLEVDADEACLVIADETLLAVLVRNLVDNAVRYSPAGARVRVAVQEQAGQAVFSIEDSGPGLSDADLQRLGERFFRVLGSGEAGSGLGWSIVRRVAAVLGAEVRVERSGLLGGLAVRVALGAPGGRA
jgi:two-component system sensor histidine kinase QseC